MRQNREEIQVFHPIKMPVKFTMPKLIYPIQLFQQGSVTLMSRYNTAAHLLEKCPPVDPIPYVFFHINYFFQIQLRLELKQCIFTTAASFR